MTREEKEQTGKYVLQMARLLEDGCYQQEMLLKAVHIIDEALEQEPTTKKDLGVDCISRQEVDRLACRYLKESTDNHVAFYEHFLDLLSVTPQEPKTGHWIEHDCKSLREMGYYRCSECNCGYQRYERGVRKSEVPYINGQKYELHRIDNFCPNCGAKMVEPQESEE